MRQPQPFSHARILQWMLFSCHRILVDTHIMSCLFSLFNHTQFRWLSSILFHYESIFWFLCHRLMLGSIFYNYRISYARQTKQCLAYKLPHIWNACQCEGNKKVGAIHVLFIFGQFKRVYPNYESQASRTGLYCTPECIELVASFYTFNFELLGRTRFDSLCWHFSVRRTNYMSLTPESGSNVFFGLDKCAIPFENAKVWWGVASHCISMLVQIHDVGFSLLTLSLSLSTYLKRVIFYLKYQLM